MQARDSDVPRFAYLVAVAAGLFLCLFSFFFLRPILERLSWAAALDPNFATFLSPVVCYGAAGALFGFLLPDAGWRWGVWLCAAPACLASFGAPGPPEFMVFLLLTLAPACACAYGAARLHMKFVEVK